MATLEIEGKRVEVDDSFLSLSTADQQSTVDEIAAQMGIAGQSAESEGGFRLGGFYENIVGEGAVDTPGEVIGDVIGTAGAGALRGVKGLLETPEMLGRAVRRGYQAVTGSEERTPVFDTATGRALGAGYEGIASAVGADPEGINRRGETTAAQYAGTVGEFLPAAIGGGAGALKTAVTAGLGSEALGQATEGTALETPARIVGAFAAPAALTGAKNKTVRAMERRAVESPSLDTARANKNSKYAAAKAAGAEVQVDMTGLSRSLADDMKNAPEELFSNYTPGVDTHIDNALKILSSRRGKTLNINQLDRIRSSLKEIYYKGKGGGENTFDPRVGFIVDKIDDAIDTAPAGISGTEAGALFNQARSANRQYKKMEMFDDLMRKAELQTASSGSGGNIVNKYRQALTSILTQPKKRAQFDPQELEIMEAMVQGSVPENVLRQVGKLSPTGNGLMTFLNLGAVAIDPAMLVATGAGMASKALADKKAVGAVDNLRRTLATGKAPSVTPTPKDRQLRILLGLQAD